MLTVLVVSPRASRAAPPTSPGRPLVTHARGALLSLVILAAPGLVAPGALAESALQEAGPGPSESAAAPVDEPGAAAAAPDAPPAVHVTVVDGDDDGAPASVAAVLEAVEFENRTYFRDETLRTFILHALPGELDEDLLAADAQRIAARFQDRGFLKAQVTVRVEPLRAPLLGAPPGVKAVFIIDAGERAELKRVKVVGNADVPESALKEGFFSRPPEPLGALTRAGFFHRPYLDQDAQRLVANYYKRGYLEARVLDTRVEAAPSLDGLAVTLRVIEGPVYELGPLVFEGDLPAGIPVESLRSKISVKAGEVCDLVSIQQQADALLEPLRLEGHPFARFEQAVQVVPPPSGNPAHRAVALTLRFVKGPKPTVREVRISGNRGTQDRVIRRDIDVKTGDPYDHFAMKATERALLATGFFSAVQARAIPTQDPNVVDIEVAVTEQQTWLASIAPAFDTTAGGEGLIGVGILADRNFLGTGLFVSTFARLSARRQTFDLTVSEPRLFDTRSTLTAELHRREISYVGFRTRSELGGGVRASVPVGSGFVVGGGLAAEYGGVVLYDETDRFAGPRLVLDGPDGGLLPANVLRNPVSLSLAWDRRDNLLLPRNGVYASLSAQYAGPLTLSGLAFLDTGASLKLFWTPVWGITLKSNTDVGVVFNPHGGEVPVTDRYFLGGLGSVRGFPVLSLSPTRFLPTEEGVDVELAVGGTTRFVQNLELEFPLWPATPFRGFVFLDAGNAFDQTELDKVFAGESLARGTRLPLGLFYSTGFGVLIETPVLPFRFEWSVPLTRRSFDQSISFFIGIGSAF